MCVCVRLCVFACAPPLTIAHNRQLFYSLLIFRMQDFMFQLKCHKVALKTSDFIAAVELLLLLS